MRATDPRRGRVNFTVRLLVLAILPVRTRTAILYLYYVQAQQ